MSDEETVLGSVRDAWAETLDIESRDVPLDEGFFDTGGTSLLLVLLYERLTAMTTRELRVTDLFRHTTVRAQARLLTADP